jgi:hypothetical protein
MNLSIFVIYLQRYGEEGLSGGGGSNFADASSIFESFFGGGGLGNLFGLISSDSKLM